jgi:hypothetical protein
VVKVTGGHNTRVSLAALIAVKPGQRPRLIYRVHHRRSGRKDKRKGFTETDYAQLLDAARQQLGGPLVVVWDNLNTHVSRAMTELIAARGWLTVFQLPPYAHELNPVELVWSHQRVELAEVALSEVGQRSFQVQDPAEADAVPARPPRRVRSLRAGVTKRFEVQAGAGDRIERPTHTTTPLAPGSRCILKAPRLTLCPSSGAGWYLGQIVYDSWTLRCRIARIISLP